MDLENGKSIGGMMLEESIKTLRNYKSLADRAIAQVKEDESLYWVSHEDVNSIAIIMRHIGGNLVSRWTDFLTTDGEKPDRDRDGEFETRRLSRTELLNEWELGWSVLFATLDALTESDLQRTVYIRQQPHSVVQAILRGAAHCAYHVGQIVHIAKTIQQDRFETLSIPKKK